MKVFICNHWIMSTSKGTKRFKTKKMFPPKKTTPVYDGAVLWRYGANIFNSQEI